MGAFSCRDFPFSNDLGGNDGKDSREVNRGESYHCVLVLVSRGPRPVAFFRVVCQCGLSDAALFKVGGRFLNFNYITI